MASLGSLILKAEKGLVITNGSERSSLSTSGGQKEVKFTNDPLKIVGDGSCVMLEWSQPSVATLARVMQHLRSEYKVLKTLQSTGDGGEAGGGRTSLLETLKVLPTVDVKFRLTDINAFLYSLTPGKAVYSNLMHVLYILLILEVCRCTITLLLYIAFVHSYFQLTGLFICSGAHTCIRSTVRSCIRDWLVGITIHTYPLTMYMCNNYTVVDFMQNHVFACM